MERDLASGRMCAQAPSLSEEKTSDFQENGYVIFEDVFGANEIARMREEADHILELAINSSLANDRQSGRLDLVEAESGEQQVRMLQPINDLSLYLSEVSEDDRVLDPLRAVMDDDPILMEEKLNSKQPLPQPIEELEGDRPSSAFPVHNDWAWYKEQGYPQSILTTGIAIDDLTVKNGTLQVWPGTHTEHVEHEWEDPGGWIVPPEAYDEEDAVALEVPAGSVMVFHSLLWHNSSPNETDGPRRLMLYSHFPETEGEAAGIAFDERNGPSRLRESPWEWEYQRKKDRGEYTDRFEAPDS
jgi:ectoine hydroxylase-related dioxygenase (phytanoyl-CoA dioxygenase family)